MGVEFAGHGCFKLTKKDVLRVWQEPSLCSQDCIFFVDMCLRLFIAIQESFFVYRFSVILLSCEAKCVHILINFSFIFLIITNVK